MQQEAEHTTDATLNLTAGKHGARVGLAASSLSLTACGGGGVTSTGGGGFSSLAASSEASSTATSASVASSQSSTSTSTSTSKLSASSQSTQSSSSSSSSSSSGGTQNSISVAQAANFLTQAGLDATLDAITQVQTLGYEGWIDAEFKKPLGTSLVKTLTAKGFDDIANKNNQAGVDNMMWRRLITGTDSLRLRVAFALAQIIVIGTTISGIRFRQFALAYYWDILETNSFGNYRTLLDQISRSPAMGAYLTFLGSRKASGNSMPDENYAREVMQLFSIGVYELNADGTLKITNGKPKETYVQEDVSQLARVFTGWELDNSVGSANTPDAVTRPMIQNAKYHELGTKQFLGVTIPLNTAGEASLKIALDTLFAHPNIAPFISRQLIQRLVTSNPSTEYVARVSAIFNDNSKGVKGDLMAVIKAILLDSEARSTARFSDTSFGKLREPVLRFVQWARTFGYQDAADTWAIGDTSDPAFRLGQSPLHSPTVFNFYRPGYVPPSAFIGNRTVPEFQITTETSVAGYINFMQNCISNGIAGTKADYSKLTPLAADSAKLLDDLNSRLAGGQLSSATLAAFKTALDSINAGTTAGLNNRIYAALTLVMASPEYIVQK